jgi:hypothetical protein
MPVLVLVPLMVLVCLFQWEVPLPLPWEFLVPLVELALRILLEQSEHQSSFSLVEREFLLWQQQDLHKIH